MGEGPPQDPGDPPPEPPPTTPGGSGDDTTGGGEADDESSGSSAVAIADQFARRSQSMFWNPWNPYPMQAASGLRDDVLATPAHSRTLACFDQREVPPFFTMSTGQILQRVIGFAGGGRSGRVVALSYESMRDQYGDDGEALVDEWLSQEYCWNRAGVNFGGGADRQPALWEEIGWKDRLEYEPQLLPGFIEGDASYQVGAKYFPEETATHFNEETRQLVRWSARDVNGDGTAWTAGEFDSNQWNLDKTGSKPAPRWFFAAGVGHYAAFYNEGQLPVTNLTWSLWQHSKIPWDPSFKPTEHHEEEDGGYPVLATKELPATEVARIRESPHAMTQIIVKRRNKANFGNEYSLTPHWV